MRGKLKGYKVQYYTHINNSLNSVSIKVSHESDWYACIRYSNPYCHGVLLGVQLFICQYVCQHLPCESNYYLQTMNYNVHVCVLHVIYTSTDWLLMTLTFDDLCQYICQHLPCESNYYLQTMSYNVHVCVLHVIYTSTDRLLMTLTFDDLCQYVCQHLPCESNYYLQTMSYNVHVCVLHVIYTSTDWLLMTLTFDDLCPGKHNSALCQPIFPYHIWHDNHKPAYDFPKVRLSDVYTLITGNHVSLVTRKPVFRVCDQVILKPGCSATETS